MRTRIASLLVSTIHQTVCTLACVGSLWCFPLPTVAEPTPNAETLFNGKDLSGWRGDPRIWSVEDGAIVGKTSSDAPIKQNTFLIYEGDDLGDFELRLKYRITGGNSGIQYRSKVHDAGKWVVGGYQADIDSKGTYTGILYEERGRGILTQRGERTTIDAAGERKTEQVGDRDLLFESIDTEGWNDYLIVARGTELQHIINGKLMSYTSDSETEKGSQKGVLALQVHVGPPMKIEFRDIELTRFGPILSQREAPSGTPDDRLSSITVKEGYQVERVHRVDYNENGSWVSLALDPQGRIYASDQYGQLYRVTPCGHGKPEAETIVEHVDLEIGMAQGMTWINDSLYVVVNGNEKTPSGLYRLRDTNGDDQLDEVQMLRKLAGGGEHGPHAVIPSPDRKSLYIVGGNHTKLPEIDASRVPLLWDEDQLLPRLWDANGHATGILAPGGWICRTDFDGESWELISMGYRNAYDIAFNRDGELFTYDADMEWDIGAPWYRPTRVCHATSGSEFGWRSGTGKFPIYYEDSLPAITNIGPGSPTGIAFGYGTAFPEPYQNALFINDWSFGKLYAVRLTPHEASYQATVEDFIIGAPLPLTDLLPNPHDGCLYFSVGGRRTESTLYRVRYVGTESTANSATTNGEVPSPSLPNEMKLRRELERHHHDGANSNTVTAAWDHLNHRNRYIRFAARTAIEHVPVSAWQDKALRESRPWGTISAAIALARSIPEPDPEVAQQLIDNLTQQSWDELDTMQQLGLLRAVQLTLIRLTGETVDEPVRQSILDYCDARFPDGDVRLDHELSILLARLDAPNVAKRCLDLVAEATTQEDRLHYMLALHSRIGKAPADQQWRFFDWFHHVGDVRGGASLRKFLQVIHDRALETLDQDARQTLADVVEVDLTKGLALPDLSARPVVKKYDVADVLEIFAADQHPDLDQGRKLFAEALCFRCHRVGAEGGSTGPDLTTAGRRFSKRDLVESIVEPDKVISDRFQATTFILNNGKTVTGRVANLHSNKLMVVTDMLAPGDFTNVLRDEIEEMVPAQTSEMPSGLLDPFTPEEIRDLLGYLISAGANDGT